MRKGNRMVEVRHQAANKSMVADSNAPDIAMLRVKPVLKSLSDPQRVVDKGEVDFIFCVGDDR
eukprot:21463-Heterococcus_DN1.PRE.1